MDLNEWRASQKAGEAVELPSGLTVMARKFGVMDLAMAGDIPEALKPMVLQFMQGEQKISSVEQLVEMGVLIGITLDRALVGPEGLYASELPAPDRQYLFNWCNTAPGFRSGPDGAVGTAQSRNGVQPETFSVGADQRPAGAGD